MAPPLDAPVGADRTASKGSRLVNSGGGPSFQTFDIGHEKYTAVIEADTAFWALVPKAELAAVLAGGPVLDSYFDKREAMAQEMDMLRFHLKPSAVYFNPTERCNLNCSYCYIPSDMRRSGSQMSAQKVLDSLARLKAYFAQTVPEGRLPQVIFHGAEPLLNREAIFQGIEAFADDFHFGIQTNATLLDDAAVSFLKDHHCSIGLSLDAPQASAADRTRFQWNGKGVFQSTCEAMKRLRGYDRWSVICTMTRENQGNLSEMVEFLHAHEVPSCMLNVLRCTLPGARPLQPDDLDLAAHYIEALERSNALYRETGRKMVVANFANILISIVAPTARRLMCDISPCGGGRSFFALAQDGDLFPCSEFIGLADFKGGNLFTGGVADALESPQFKQVTERKVEDVARCKSCAIRHFCGAPCPAEAHEMNGGMDQPGAFCEFYVEQARYAFRLLAEQRENEFLWEAWDADTEMMFAPL